MSDSSFDHTEPRRRFPMEFLAIVGFLAAWILLQLVILPKMGVSTSMSSACGPSSRSDDSSEIDSPEATKTKQQPFSKE